MRGTDGHTSAPAHACCGDEQSARSRPANFEKSADKLGVEQIDLLILHQALPSAFDRTLEAYRALETLLAHGKVRAIGVSNFMVDRLTTLLDRAGVVPAVNQIELHPLSRAEDRVMLDSLLATDPRSEQIVRLY